MKRLLHIMLTGVLSSLLLLFNPLVFAEPVDGDGGGGGAGGGDHESPDYGDLVYLLRDSDGIPIPDSNLCRQPLAFPSETCTLTCDESVPCVVPLGDLCEIQVGYETCVREVEFGRMSVARSPDLVFERQLEDLMLTLSGAGQIQLDPAGRLMAVSQVEVDGETVVKSSTIDSPLQNLVIYWKMMQQGELTGITLPDPDFGITAARALGAASDKSGKVDVDVVAYLNRIMGLTAADAQTKLGKKCAFFSEEVNGVMQTVEECFLDYGGYGYMRKMNFPQLPHPPRVPADDPQPGWFEYLWLYPDATTPDDRPLFYIEQGPIVNAVFPLLDAEGAAIDVDPGNEGGNIAGFAQAADDARAVINFMHTNPVPVDYESKVIFEGDDGTSTASTSSDSGGCSVSGGKPATDPLLLVIVLAALGYLGAGMTRRI
jgi:hypothetical protein